MKRLSSLLSIALVAACQWLNAAVVTTSPAILQEDSKNVKIIFDATQGTGGMVGATDCYAHTGCTINGVDWQKAPTWGDNSDKYKLTSIGTNLWQLDMGDIREYYGVTDPNQHITKLEFVFRNGAKTKEGKDVGGADIYVEVHESGLAVQVSTTLSNVFLNKATSVPVMVSTTTTADIKLFLNKAEGTPLATKNGATELQYTHNANTVGNYYFIAEATAGGKTERDTLAVCYRPNSAQQAYSGKLYQGATENADGSVTFCLLAPSKTNVMLVGEWNDYRPDVATMMNYQNTDANNLSGKFFWTTVKGLDRTKEYGYYFLVDDQLIVADPYGKMIMDPWNDKYITAKAYPGLRPFPQEKVGTNIISVYKGNIDDYDWEVKNFQTPERGNLIVYELLVRDFTDEGTITAATNKLPYLERLGVNAIELMPVQEFSGNDSWGYNPTFYFAADKAYGSAKAYRRFIDECHKRGIAVILDVVFNHVWGDHPWCKMYWNSTTNKPTPASPFFNVDAPHDFSVGNDWKQESPFVRQYFADVLKYWTKEYKIDGYRFDLAKGYADSQSYSSLGRDAFAYNSTRIENEKRMMAAAKSVNPRSIFIFESFVAYSEEQAIGAAGGMSWRQMMKPSQQQVGMYQSGSALDGYNDGNNYWVSYADSHDEERLGYWAKAYASDKTEATYCLRIGSLAALEFLSRGAKMLYEFDEMGYDIALGGDNVKMTKKARFWNRLTQPVRRGLYDSFCEIINLRVNNPDLFNSTEFYPAYAQANWADGRFITARNAAKTKQLVVAVNVTNTQKTFSYTFDNPGATYYVNSKSYGTNPVVNTSAGTITLPAHGYAVISNMAKPFDISGIDISDLDFSPDVDGVEAITVESKKGPAQLRIYPNPATDVVTVIANDVKLIEVYSMSGNLVARQAGGDQINVSDLATGTYIVRATTEDGTSVAKLLKR